VSSDSLDPFQVFGLPSDAPLDQIRRRYRQLALAYHPDRRGGNDPRQARKFQIVLQAYEAILRIREASERDHTFGPCAACGLIAALVPRLDGTMVCTPCLIRPARMRMLPPPPLVILKCYFPILCMVAGAVLLVLYYASGKAWYGAAACGVAVVGFLVVAVVGFLVPVQPSEELRRLRSLRSRRRRQSERGTSWLGGSFRSW